MSTTNFSNAISTGESPSGSQQWSVPRYELNPDAVYCNNASCINVNDDGSVTLTNSALSTAQLKWQGDPNQSYRMLGTSMAFGGGAYIEFIMSYNSSFNALTG